MSPARTYRLLLTVGLLQQMLFAQAALHETSIRDGIYTTAQAQQGKAIYQDQCSVCHGDALEGSRRNSPLAGMEFLNRWIGQSVADLFMKTIVMMPATDPGAMTPKDTAAVIAYILSENKFPSGKAELPTDPRFLEMIPIVKP
ncbi:MAG TPA: cytochrome c [Bryobacteraceae bacterium]|jgi:mono/diheme cytochrome c family protein|nr:cytochrome c [Bryobacteraceae bacterium]